MENHSGLKPLGVAVLIKPYEPERRGAQIVIPDGVAGRLSMVDNRAVVVEIGPSAWHDEGIWESFLWIFRRWRQVPRAKVGDRVLVTKFAGFLAKGPEDEQMYRLVNDRDVFCGIAFEEGEQNAT